VGPRLLLIIAAVLFSTGGAAIKYNSLTAWQVACSRSLISAVALWIALPGVRRRWTPALVAVGCAYATMLLLFVTATKLTTAANAIFLQSTAPLYLLFIGPVLLKEPLRRSDWMLMAAMTAGMSLFFVSTEPAVATAPNPQLGNLLAAASGLAWAVILYLGTCQIALAYWCLAKGLRHVPAFETAAIVLVEPALNPVWTWMVLGETPGALAIIGGSILLTATALNAWWQARRGPVVAA
jgi:drug/metabolite transporter (DMT)-like permease